MATVWNGSDKSAGITLSATNHLATSAGGGNFGVRGTPTSHGTSSGKYYIEYTSIVSSGGSGKYGFANSGDTLGGAGQFGVDPGGNLGTPAGSVAMGSAPDGKTLALAVDFNNAKIWARYDAGSWVGNGASPDPATNTSGLNLGAYTSPVLPYTWLQNGGGTCRINSGDSAFLQSVPSGFVAWDAAPPPNYFKATVLCYNPKSQIGWLPNRRIIRP